MAAPNIVNVSGLYLKSDVADVPSSTGTIQVNAAGSGLAIKLTSMYCANIDGSSSVDVTVTLVKADASSAALASTVPVSADSTQVLITKEAPVVLEEGDYVTSLGSAANDAQLVYSWEEYS